MWLCSMRSRQKINVGKTFNSLRHGNFPIIDLSSSAKALHVPIVCESALEMLVSHCCRDG